MADVFYEGLRLKSVFWSEGCTAVEVGSHGVLSLTVSIVNGVPWAVAVFDGIPNKKGMYNLEKAEGVLVL